ncbi:hypothetical protein Tco_1305633 [Tanacetum coccineum]
MAVPISTREPKRTVNQSAATPLKRTVVAEPTNQKPRSTIRKQYEQIIKKCKWWYCKITPPGYKWKPKSRTVNVEPNLVEIILFIVDSGCSKHMMGNLKLLSNFVEQFLGTVKYGNDQIVPILGSRGTDLYSITLQDTSTPNPICLIDKATSSQACLSPGPQSQENISHSAETVTTSNELDLLFSPMFDELLNGTTPVVSKSSAVTAADPPNQRQQQNTTPSTLTTVVADIPPLNIQTTPETTNQVPTQAPIVTAIENINQAETYKENTQVEEDKFINIFSTPVQEQGETSSHYVDSTRRQLETDDEMCMFALTVSQTEPKNIKEAIADSAWIEAMQEELYQFN